MKTDIIDYNQIEWDDVKDSSLLREGAEYYSSISEFEQSKFLLLKAYKITSFKPSILKDLIKVCLELNDLSEANDYLTEFKNNYKNDIEVNYLEYRVLKGLGYSADELIAILENIQKSYYKEKWMYDLAKEYEQAGLIQKCLNQCDQIELWFNGGLYVAKAIKLKGKYKPLNNNELDIVKQYEDEIKKDDIREENKIYKKNSSEINMSHDIHEEPKEILKDEDYDVKIYKPNKVIETEEKSRVNIVDNLLSNIDMYSNENNNKDEDIYMFGKKKQKENRPSIKDLENEQYDGDLKDVDYFEEEYDRFDDNLTDEYIDDEYLDDEYLDDEYLDDEYLDDEYLDDEYLDDEYLDDEYLDDEYLDDEYLEDEYLEDEYLEDEYLDDEYLDDEYLEVSPTMFNKEYDIENYAISDSCKIEEIRNKSILSDYEDLTDEELAIILDGEKEEVTQDKEVNDSIINNSLEDDKVEDDKVEDIGFAEELIKPIELKSREDSELDIEGDPNKNIDDTDNIGYLDEDYLKLPDNEDILYENQNMEEYAIDIDDKVIDEADVEEMVEEIYLDEEADEENITVAELEEINEEIDSKENEAILDENIVSDDNETVKNIDSDQDLPEELDIENNSTVDEQIMDHNDDEYLKDEISDDEQLDVEQLDDEYLDDEYLDDEYLDDEYLDDEYLDDEYLDDEYLDDEYLDDEYLEDEYLEDEYLEDEYLEDEYLEDEYLDDEYIDNNQKDGNIIKTVNIDENYVDIIPEESAINLDSFASFGSTLKILESTVDEIDSFENLRRYNKTHILLKGESKKLLEQFALTYCKLRGMTSTRKVSTISGDKLNIVDIRELYTKIPNTFLIIKNSEDIVEETYNSIVKAVNFNDNTILIFTTTNSEIDLENHLLDKMVTIKKEIPNILNDYVTYSVLYAGLKGYRFTEYAIEMINANIDEITLKDDSFAAFEKVVNCSIMKQRQHIEENMLTELVVGTYNDETLIGEEVVLQALQELMDKDII